jgi:hypothetical protein
MVEGKRPDVTIRNLVFTEPDLATGVAYQKLRAGGPVYTSSALPSLGDDVDLVEIPLCSCSKLVLTGSED